jgi:hypothetical protein
VVLRRPALHVLSTIARKFLMQQQYTESEQADYGFPEFILLGSLLNHGFVLSSIGQIVRVCITTKLPQHHLLVIFLVSSITILPPFYLKLTTRFDLGAALELSFLVLILPLTALCLINTFLGPFFPHDPSPLHAGDPMGLASACVV